MNRIYVVLLRGWVKSRLTIAAIFDPSASGLLPLVGLLADKTANAHPNESHPPIVTNPKLATNSFDHINEGFLLIPNYALRITVICLNAGVLSWQFRLVVTGFR
jgi:hypothetical protein